VSALSETENKMTGKKPHARTHVRTQTTYLLEIVDGDELLSLLFLKLDDAIDAGEKGVVLASADVVPGVEGVADLADDDTTGLDGLIAVHLNTTTLGVGITAVLGGAGTLLVGSLNEERSSHGPVGDIRVK